jgi:glycine cleavage system H protein
MAVLKPTHGVPADLRFTADHLWLGAERDGWLVGITGFAAARLGDLVFVDIPSAGTVLHAGVAFTFVESSKAVVDVPAPISAVVLAGNHRLSEAPDLINRDPYGAGWICLIESPAAGQLAGLLDAVAYERLLSDVMRIEDL